MKKIVKIIPLVLVSSFIASCNKNTKVDANKVDESEWKYAINYIYEKFISGKNFTLTKRIKVNNENEVVDSVVKVADFKLETTYQDAFGVTFIKREIENATFGYMNSLRCLDKDNKEVFKGMEYNYIPVNDGHYNVSRIYETTAKLYNYYNQYNTFTYNSTSKSFERPKSYSSDELIYSVSFNENKKVSKILSQSYSSIGNETICEYTFEYDNVDFKNTDFTNPAFIEVNKKVDKVEKAYESEPYTYVPGVPYFYGIDFSKYEGFNPTGAWNDPTVVKLEYYDKSGNIIDRTWEQSGPFGWLNTHIEDKVWVNTCIFENQKDQDRSNESYINRYVTKQFAFENRSKNTKMLIPMWANPSAKETPSDPITFRVSYTCE